MIGRFFSATSLAFLGALQVEVSQACSCGRYFADNREAVEFFFPVYTTVFRGTVQKVIKVHGDDPFPEDEFNSGYYEATISVSKIWKNEENIDQTSTTVYTWPNSGLCGVPFVAGEEYIIYSREESLLLGPESDLAQVTGMCARQVTGQEEGGIDDEAIALDDYVVDNQVALDTNPSTSTTKRYHICAESHSKAKNECWRSAGDCSHKGDERCGDLSKHNAKKHCFVVQCPHRSSSTKLRKRFI
eukprot:CAMPEP_0197446400 /NCGR_PEP_ID=MMETSP1175-20131217/11356_1 /TAXON_ID=1003142 /ORGANISM="Triceratium dubium, Strain CCMP147" /LENGTH=243 /DNA_ID=CAMNT_0042977507 /DNA_START=143 /DNA_END=874 /DNA_ORIENTATION=-